MSDDLVKWLRDRGVCSPAHNSCQNDAACEHAADRIEALEAERDKWHAGWMEAEAKVSELEAARDALAEKLKGQDDE